MRSRPKRESLVQKYAAPTNQRLCALKSDRLLGQQGLGSVLHAALASARRPGPLVGPR